MNEKIQNLKDCGTILVFKVDEYRYIHAGYDADGTYYIEAFYIGQSPDWHGEYDTAEEFEAALLEEGDLSEWEETFLD